MTLLHARFSRHVRLIDPPPPEVQGRHWCVPSRGHPAIMTAGDQRTAAAARELGFSGQRWGVVSVWLGAWLGTKSARDPGFRPIWAD